MNYVRRVIDEHERLNMLVKFDKFIKFENSRLDY